VSGIAALLLATVWWTGFGNSSSALARHPLPVAVAYVALTGAFAAGLLQVLAYRAALKALPYPAGVYLFGASLIDARRRKLLVYPLDTLTNVTAGGPETIIARFGEVSFTFPVTPFDREQIVERIREASQQMALGVDDGRRQALDPLVPPAISSPLASDVALTDRRPRWARARWVLAGVIALAGAPLYLLRDDLSDASMFADAQSRDDIAAYEQYLARGEAHRTIVSRKLLPQAALRAAVAEGTVEAIQKFREAYPDTDIQAEIDAALRAALDTAFAAATKQGTLTALSVFADRYPDHGLEAPLAKARHGIYTRALEQLRAKIPPRSKRIASFVDPLFAAIEKAGTRKTPAGVRGPAVELRLRRVPSRAVDGADDLVRRNPWFAGEISFPSRYLDAAHVGPHEKAAAESLAEAFSREIDPEIATFTAADPLDGTVKELPAVEIPTLVISYRVEPSGAGYASKKPRCVFVGLVFFFEMTFLLPGDAKPLVLNHTAAMRIPSALIVNRDKSAPRGALEASVYEAMLRDGFAEGRKRYVSVWFGESK
jgi:hypothetical protein